MLLLKVQEHVIEPKRIGSESILGWFLCFLDENEITRIRLAQF